uniref:t-SNARE coiled-coil homology domain-containing protein n=1 Tax=Strongyloides papillosus TaxID=174720 RepID=A0A0N5BM83_STREA
MSKHLGSIFQLDEIIAELENLAAIMAGLNREIEQYISIFDKLPSEYQSRVVMLINKNSKYDDEINSMKAYADRLKLYFITLLNIMKVLQDE